MDASEQGLTLDVEQRVARIEDELPDLVFMTVESITPPRLIIESDGTLATFRPQDGKHLKDYPIASDIVTAPIIAGGAMYLVDKSATLHKYY